MDDVGAGLALLQSLERAGELVSKGSCCERGPKVRSVLRVEAARPERAESGSRRLERADKLAKPACGSPPTARPGSSEVEQPPCKRPVGGSNPFPGSLWRSPAAPSHLLKSRFRLLPYSGAPHRVPRGRGRGCARAAKGSRL